MRKVRLFFIVALLAVLSSCFDGDDYCAGPQEVSGFKDIQSSYPADRPVSVELDFIFNFGQELNQTTTLFTFSVPDVFINPKGDDRPIDVVAKPQYTYKLKDPTNPPASVTISGYAFNDCGKSATVTAVINFR